MSDCKKENCKECQDGIDRMFDEVMNTQKTQSIEEHRTAIPEIEIVSELKIEIPAPLHRAQVEAITKAISKATQQAKREVLEEYRKRWVKIFDDMPIRERTIESDEWTRNIARLEIDHIDELLLTQKKDGE